MGIWKGGSVWSAWPPTLLCHPNPRLDSDPRIRKISITWQQNLKEPWKWSCPIYSFYRWVIWTWWVKWLVQNGSVKSRLQGSWPPIMSVGVDVVILFLYSHLQGSVGLDEGIAGVLSQLPTIYNTGKWGNTFLDLTVGNCQQLKRAPRDFHLKTFQSFVNDWPPHFIEPDLRNPSKPWNPTASLCTIQ